MSNFIIYNKVTDILNNSINDNKHITINKFNDIISKSWIIILAIFVNLIISMYFFLPMMLTGMFISIVFSSFLLLKLFNWTFYFITLLIYIFCIHITYFVIDINNEHNRDNRNILIKILLISPSSLFYLPCILISTSNVLIIFHFFWKLSIKNRSIYFISVLLTSFLLWHLVMFPIYKYIADILVFKLYN